MLEVKSEVIRSYLALAISANNADVNLCHRTIAEGESLEQILNNLLQESCKLMP